MGSSRLALMKCFTNWKMNTRRLKESVFGANNKMQSIVLNTEDFIIFPI